MKNFFKFLAIGFPFLLAVVTLSSMGGAKAPGGSAKKNPDDPNPPATITYKDATIVLYAFTSNGTAAANPSERHPSYSGASVPVTPSLWSGGASAPGVFINTNQYYCKISIATQNGPIKDYTWKADAGSTNQMTIQIPSNVGFQLTVEYWEQCGPYWTSTHFMRRGVWLYEATIPSYSSILSVNNWMFVRSEPC